MKYPIGKKILIEQNRYEIFKYCSPDEYYCKREYRSEVRILREKDIDFYIDNERLYVLD